MKLRTKATIFFGTFILAIALSVFFYAEVIVGNVFKKQATDNLRIIAEQSESTYLAFLGSIETRIIDWTSDSTIRNITKEILATPEGSSERARLAQEFATYLKGVKLPLDKTVVIVDLLDKDGIIIASTELNRIGEDEKSEETEHRKVHDIDATLHSKFGEVFFGTIVINGDESHTPLMNATVRMFDVDKNGEYAPLDAVLLVYLSNTVETADVLGSGKSVYTGSQERIGRLTNKALIESYQTSNIYLVNNSRILVTPTREIKDTSIKQKVDTPPVQECLEKGKEVSGEYDDYRGVRVLGASMCFRNEGIVLITEIEKDEIFEPLTDLNRSTALIGLVALIFGTFIVVFFVQKNLTRISNIILTARKVAGGDLSAKTDIATKDEIGYLAAVFNTMITSVRDNQESLLRAKRNVEKEKVKDEALLISIGEGVLATDSAGDITIINHVAEQILGWNASEVIGKKATEVILVMDEAGNMVPTEEHAIPATLKTRTTITSDTMQYVNKKTGKHTPVAVTVNPVILEGKLIGAVAIFRDITKEKELEETRRDLLSLASHQLRTPLSGTKWLIETLQKGIHGTLSKEQGEYLNEIYKINERMTTLVHDMLSVLRMESGITSTKKENVSLRDLVRAVFDGFDAVAKNKQISLRLAEGEDCAIEVDPLLLRNIIEGLLSNAINYSNLDNEAVISIKKESDEVVIAVKDSGIGIPKSEQRQIFSRFYRASNAKTFDTHGTGLGLYITSMLAKKIGASLSFESAEGQGSTFYIHLPLETSNGVVSLSEDLTRV